MPTAAPCSRRIHTPRYLAFLEGAWTEWLALDPVNADRQPFPSVWPVRTLRSDVEPANFTARLGLYSMDNGTPLSAGTWAAAKAGADAAALRGAATGRRGARRVLRHAPARPPCRCRLHGRLLLPEQRRRRRPGAARAGLRPGGGAGRGLPPRQRHAEPLLRPRRRAVRQPARRPAHRVPVLPGPCRRDGRRRGPGLST